MGTSNLLLLLLHELPYINWDNNMYGAGSQKLSDGRVVIWGKFEDMMVLRKYSIYGVMAPYGEHNWSVTVDAALFDIIRHFVREGFAGLTLTEYLDKLYGAN